MWNLIARTLAVAFLIMVAGVTASAFGILGDSGRVALYTETFPVEHLRMDEVHGLLEAYVWEEREGAGGAASFSSSGVTVRETRDNLTRIEETLAEFDRPRDDVRLHFQLIEANGFTDSDPRIASVETELRKLFQFEGYRLAAESAVTAADGTSILQGMRRSGGEAYEVKADVRRLRSGQIRLSDVSLETSDGWALSTSVSIRIGQTIVLGSTPTGEAGSSLFLTVRASTADSVADGPA